MRQQKRKRERPYSVDKLVRQMAASLARDFQHQLDTADATNVTELLLNSSVAEIRAYDWHQDTALDPYTFKCRYQMQDLLKKYRFQKDQFSTDELAEAAEMQFFDNQCRLVDIDLDSLPAFCKHVLFVAAGYCHQILGNYELEEHYQLCRHGRKASVGIPMREATEAARYEAPITGSPEHITWFSTVHMAEDTSACRYILERWALKDAPLFRDVSELALTFVPKTFKSLRSIMPNTTIGAFYSDGLGKVLAQRLRDAGYDITSLQMKHRDLAREGSITGELVTADQSLASDNITVALVQAILPRAWFNAANLGRVEWVKTPTGLRVKTPTFCTMGIGFTFPLQTLIFLCLLKAIDQCYTHGRSRVSVYGDDLIYSRSMHPFVMTIFNRLGLKINTEKTFADGCFRESCGSDFYAGVDVRPFQPKNERGSLVGRRDYEALLYIYTNGLLRRWHREEVPETLNFLLDELSKVSRGVLRVPPDYPDSSGIKVESPYDTLNKTCLLAPVKHGKHGKVTFMYLRFQPQYMEMTQHAPYLWRWLGGGTGSDLHRPSIPHPGVLRSGRLLRFIEGQTGVDRDLPLTFHCEDGKRPGGTRRRTGKTSSTSVERPTLIPRPGGVGRTLRQTSSTVRWS